MPDPGTVKQHYEAMVQGKLSNKSGGMEGYGRLGRLFKNRGYTVSSGNGIKQPIVKLVTPTAMATEQARAQLVSVRKSRLQSRKPKKRPMKKKQKGKGQKKKKSTSGHGRKKSLQSASRRRPDNFSK